MCGLISLNGTLRHISCRILTRMRERKHYKAEELKQTYGWRGLTRGVDVALIDDIATSGGRVWRTHAFGYLLRRTKGHHTWDVDSQYFLRNAYQKWEGFASEVVGVVDE